MVSEWEAAAGRAISDRTVPHVVQQADWMKDRWAESLTFFLI
jgi:hypothetical protein